MAHEITALKQQKRNPERVNVYLDGEFAFGLAKIVAAWLQVGQALDDAKIEELQARDEVEKAYQRALHFLSYRPRSCAEVERNLRKHEVPEATIETVIERLQNKNLLDDAKFAQLWVENRSSFRPRGPFALRAELRQKGVADAIIERALEALDEDELARQAAQRKARKIQHLEWEEFRKKMSAHLARRGFSYELVAEICREAWQDAQQTSTEHNNANEMRK